MSNSSNLSFSSGLSKRAFFLGRVKEALERWNEEEAFAILFLNLDRFRLVNYGFSYAAGDQLILEVQAHLEKLLQPDDIITQLQADEFAILLRKGETVEKLVEAIQKSLEKPFKVKGQDVFVSTAIGSILAEPGDGVQPEELLRNASMAMHRAKAHGLGQYQKFEQTFRVRAAEEFDLESELHQAVERHEFQIYYQPIVALGSGDFKGFEALVRWQHPRHGFSYAAEFLALAEETGLIVPISDWVLHEACRQAEQWQQQFGNLLPIGINVNLSRKQFARPDLVEQIEHALNESNLAAPGLKLEIPETVLMENPGEASKQLARLKNLGVEIQLDDFGVGQSSLSWLNEFMVDVLKVDKNFLRRLTESKKTEEVVRAIVNLGHNLGLTVVAKGVETDEQLEQIKEMKFDYVQGYLLSEPLDSQSATEWLNEYVEVMNSQNQNETIEE
jgi:diguanylate cyclase (GGDEF)-like protein